MNKTEDDGYPYYETRSGYIVVKDGYWRDCKCRMNPCDVPWHYAKVGKGEVQKG